ncbi:MAG TPA: 30S ribosomal protein S6 [Bacteriovoracaceae bacterium]|nr:30S ribosomal protein S6 [Bacteriovoracaceae bacterium]
MIYETAFVVRPDASEEVVNSIKTALTDVFKEYSAEVLVTDSWGVKTFAQPAESGLKKGAYHYFMYQGPGKVNAEIERRFGINENMVRHIIVKLGEDKDKDAIVKLYVNPNHSQAAQVEDEYGGGEDKDKKMHSKRKSCWFSAKKSSPDWKDPKSYSWLVNEFGKISPARITGLTPTFQRRANESIKRGRNMLLISYQSDETAR